MNIQYRDFLIRSWQTDDRSTAEIVGSVLSGYGLSWVSQTLTKCHTANL